LDDLGGRNTDGPCHYGRQFANGLGPSMLRHDATPE
jgi:hypothetical protein